MNITEFVPEGHDNAIKREDLRIVTGMDDRTMRDALNKSDAFIINLMDGKGYFIPLPSEVELVRQWEAITYKRIMDEKKRLLKGQKWMKERLGK